ncbi:hypothetical protein PMZ80_000446 [Knufia obscura]|uniref:glucan 1,3-beta-glucosidase n=1 Tax=Knufia obscura TaxID=1635080 RepID=A0ABR0S0D5_9EURO|nr:hypothetical protein PMZ80_000446 [Knufia obscura]
MPKERRRCSTARADADARPSFARPPGAKATPPSSYPSQQPSPVRRRSRSREHSRYYSEGTSDDDDSWSELERRRRGDPPQPQRKSKTRPSKAKESPAVSPVKKARTRTDGHRYRESDDEHERRGQRERDRHKRKTSEPPIAYDRGDRERDRAKYTSGSSANSGTQLLSSNALSKLNEKNELAEFDAKRKARKKREKEYEQLKKDSKQTHEQKKRKKNRDVSGAILEEGRSGQKRRRKGGGGGGYGSYDEYDEKRELRRETKAPMSRKKKWLIIGAVALVVLIIVIVAAVIASKNKKGGEGNGDDSGGAASSASAPTNDCDASDTPESAKGTLLDISLWLDTTDFNCTYTTQTVGGLSVMGLNSDWDDSVQANENTPALNKQWQYGKMPVRGTNIGGWLNLEPFITPSMFNYPASDNVVDEWTLCQKLGSNCARTMENHYATFITKSDFKAIRDAGLDHVRIPYGYWAVKTYDGDPFVEGISWRYLLRAIEWCREYGLRVNLDIHGVPGSQNGWAHSGHQGTINWLNGPDGDENGQRTLDIHDQLSQFFAQDRYKNVVAFYGLVNEPKMINMDDPSKVIDWNEKAIALVRKNGIEQQLVFHDGFLALTEWENTMKGVDDKLMLDTHQYQIFNLGQLKLSHADKINVACSGWTGIMTVSNNPSTGWGPTVNGEWSQADTDCTPNLNNVGAGSRWAGNLNTDTGAGAVQVNTPTCAEPPCSCAMANADPSQYTDSYKRFLQMYAEAQMHSFEQAQGWFYWTWKTESATQWSWKLGLAAGILPEKAYAPDFKCDSDVPDFSDLPDSY